ncbi:MAG: spore germination protein [Ruminococcus sp.]|nr:spore germination protein [Ruminococcus sp.]
MYNSLKENISYLKQLTSSSADFTIRELTLSNNVKCAVFTTEGMSDKQELAISVINPLLSQHYGQEGDELFDYIFNNVLTCGEIAEIKDFDEALKLCMSGFAIFALDGCDKMLSIGVQGFAYRGITEPESELVQRGSREGFTEAVRVNMSLIRRRMKNPALVFETMRVGSESNTEVSLCYLNNKATPSSVSEVKNRLKACDLKVLLGSGYLVPYLEDSGKNEIFTGIGITERPDTLCGKLIEGRIGIIVDGTPSALVLPHLFVENFQSVDDYSNRPYFAAIIRILKYISYFVSILFPALYIAFVTFHPEYFPSVLLKNIQKSIDHTPLPPLLEVLMIDFVYEIMREAGLRLPKVLGHAVSIVGALVIGDCAVSAGIIGAPTLMAVAVAAICSYVIPDLYPQITVLRLSFIVMGGILGVWGIVMLSAVVLIFMCSKSTLGVVFVSPVSPFSKKNMRDVFVRLGWKKLSKYNMNVQNLKGGSAYEE